MGVVVMPCRTTNEVSYGAFRNQVQDPQLDDAGDSSRSSWARRRAHQVVRFLDMRELCLHAPAQRRLGGEPCSEVGEHSVVGDADEQMRYPLMQ
jgi:hypothetical protein